MSFEISVDVEMEYYPGCDMRMYMPNGDPGYPAESPEAEVQKVFIGFGDDRKDISELLSPDEITDLEDQFLQEEPEDDGPGY